MMLAACYHHHGSPEKVVKVQEMPHPGSPGPGELLIRVKAASLNPADWKSGKGEQGPLLRFDWPRVYGFDFSGEVLEVGPPATGEDSCFKVGDHIFGMINGLPQAGRGTVAEFAIVSARVCALKPVSVSHEGCASVPLVAITAVKMFRACKLTELSPAGSSREGLRVLITGGAGGMGTMAIQLAKKLYGASFVATTASGTKADLCRRLGADRVVDHRNEDFSRVLANSDEAELFDAILDCVGEAKRCVGLLRKGGTLVSILSGPTQLALTTWLQESRIDPARITFGVQGFLLSSWGGIAFEAASGARSLRRACERKGASFAHVIGTGNGEIMAMMAKLLAVGDLQPVVDRSFPLQDSLAAILYQASGRAAGKVVITI